MTAKAHPKVSVVIPAYNRSGIIGRTIDSVLAQSEQSFEIIVVDDCSQDANALQQLIKDYADDRLLLLRHETNRHGAAARNTGILASRGEFLALLDSDDIWAPEKLERSMQAWRNHNDVIYTKLENDGHLFPDRAKYPQERVGDYLILADGCIQTSTLLMSSKLAKDVLFDDSLTRFQDYDFTIRLEQQGASFIYVDEALTEMPDDGNDERISRQTDYRPGIYWMQRTTGLSEAARLRFYINRVVRLMVIGGNSDKIFSLMPQDIRSNLKPGEYCRLLVLRLTPFFVVSTARALHRAFKKARANANTQKKRAGDE